MKTNSKGVALIKQFEGLSLTGYRCPAGLATIGYGSTRNVSIGMTISQAEAEARLIADLEGAEKGLDAVLKSPLNENQYSALTSLVFNVGIAKIGGSTLLRLVNVGEVEAAAAQFLRWVFVNGKRSAGLERRRAAERALFESPL